MSEENQANLLYSPLDMLPMHMMLRLNPVTTLFFFFFPPTEFREASSQHFELQEI